METFLDLPPCFLAGLEKGTEAVDGHCVSDAEVDGRVIIVRKASSRFDERRADCHNQSPQDSGACLDSDS